MPSDSHQVLDVTQFRRAMARIHAEVAAGCRRVEVTRRGCDDVCVVISKSELESLERALDILCETESYKLMCDNLARLAAECGVPAVASGVQA